MVIISIGGGLGNQMFEYAYYTKLKMMHPEIDIKLDILHTFPSHNGYELKKIFGVTGEECTKKDIARLSEFYPKDGRMYCFFSLLYRLRRKIGFHKKTFYKQNDYSEYYDLFFNVDVHKDYYFLGVFANIKYFKGIEDTIKSLYCFPPFTDSENIKLAEKIVKEVSVSLHVRRGDYITLGISTPSKEYYHKSMRYIENHTKEKVNYYFFTNDIEYVVNEFSDIENKTIVTCNKGENSYRDMQLMAMCKHNIIANSTFSFWGAFLNPNIDKIVIAPDLLYTGLNNKFVDNDWVLIKAD